MKTWHCPARAGYFGKHVAERVSMPTLTNSKRTIVITGVSRGLGKALAMGFAELGHTVIGCARGAAELERLKKDLGPQHSFSVVDITSDEQVQAWAQRVLRISQRRIC
jgi:NAD(P)-dependent dehydrogenase (short-subunit alcohol dehydrogenase family)